MAITTVKHVDIFIAIYRDFKRVGQRFVKGKRADLFATAMRVLEMMRKEQIKKLVASGLDEDSLTEEQLGFAMTWELFCERAIGHYGRRSFEGIIGAILEAKVALRRYVECHRRKKPEGGEELILVCDESGVPYTYSTIGEAREQRKSGGEIINYFYFNAGAVNDLIKEIYHLASPTPPPDGNPGPKGTKNGGAQQVGTSSVDVLHVEQPPAGENNSARVGNKQTVLFSTQNISQVSQNCEGTPSQKTRRYHSTDTPSQPAVSTGSQNCETPPRKNTEKGSQNCEAKARKTASNKNNKKESLELPEEIILNSARAIDPLSFSQFDFSQTITPEVVLQLGRMLYAPLPARYRTELDKEKAYARLESAAQALANMPSAHEIGLRNLAATMAYQADESSPCSWRAQCREKYNNPGFVPRLWNLESETVLRRMTQERERVGWWPEYLPNQTGLVESPPVIDLAELAGIDQAERIGMDASTTQIVEDWLKPQLEPHGYQIIPRRVGPTRARGYCIEVRYEHEDGSQRGLRFYRFDDWDLIIEADGVAPMGSLEFVRHLSEAVRRAWVA